MRSCVVLMCVLWWASTSTGAIAQNGDQLDVCEPATVGAAPDAACGSGANDAPVLIAPLKNLQVIFGFYDRRFVGYNGGQEHAGVDLAAVAGAPVYAICDGHVALSRADRAEIVSAVLVLEHLCPEPVGKVFGYYGHIYSELQQGDSVSAGATIGTVRDWRANSHLHLGLGRNLVEQHWGTYPRGTPLHSLMSEGWLNPLNYLSGVTIAPSNGYAHGNGYGSGNRSGYRNGNRNSSKNGNSLKRVLPKSPVYRQNGARNVPRKR